MSIDLESLGKRIKRQRQYSKMTQEKLAEKAEISNVYVSKLENGLANPTLQTLRKISASLKISPSYLLEGHHYEQNSMRSELATLLEDCSPYTLKLLTSVVKAIKSSSEESD